MLGDLTFWRWLGVLGSTGGLARTVIGSPSWSHAQEVVSLRGRLEVFDLLGVGSWSKDRGFVTDRDLDLRSGTGSAKVGRVASAGFWSGWGGCCGFCWVWLLWLGLVGFVVVALLGALFFGVFGGVPDV